MNLEESSREGVIYGSRRVAFGDSHIYTRNRS
jgi:hypothetical protein